MFKLIESWAEAHLGTYHLKAGGSVSFLEVEDGRRYFKEQGQLTEVTPQMEEWLMQEVGKVLSKIRETIPGLGEHQSSFSLFLDEEEATEAYLSFVFPNFLKFPEVTSGWTEIRVGYR